MGCLSSKESPVEAIDESPRAQPRASPRSSPTAAAGGRKSLVPDPYYDMDAPKVARIAQREPFSVQVVADQKYQFCTCGHSSSQPFCDGTHIAINKEFATNFQPAEYVAPKSGTKKFCGCKRSKAGILCDGSHLGLPPEPESMGVPVSSQMGPYHVQVKEGKTVHYCTCGLTKNQPFCDGSHGALNRANGYKFRSLAFKASKSGTARFCGCRKSQHGIVCDGEHVNLISKQKKASKASCESCPSRLQPIVDIEDVGNGYAAAPTQASHSQLEPYVVTCSEGQVIYYCSCGRSENQPFCDGSHEKVNERHNTTFAPRPYTATADGPVSFCGCRTTGAADGVVCDGSHEKLKKAGVVATPRSVPSSLASEEIRGAGITRRHSEARVYKQGPVEVKVEAGRSYLYCTCGRTKTQPFCDFSHGQVNRTLGTKFEPVTYVPKETGIVRFCGCRRTGDVVICDGTHNNLSCALTDSYRAPVDTDFAPYTVTGVEEVSPDTVVVMLKGRRAPGEDIQPSYHFSARLPNTGVARPYTPVSYNARTNEVELLVKKVPDGAVSPSLCALKEGDSVELRGPSPGEYEVVAGKHKSLLLLAAGSGLTPILQIVQALCTMGEGKTEVVLVYSNKTEADILLRTELLQLQEAHPNVLKSVVFCVTRGPKDLEAPLHSGRVSRELLEKLFGDRAKSNAHAVVCGTPEFNVACSELCAKIGLGEKDVTLS
eukprot:Rhum_TRINITY_DN14623_c8_g1::Rhum_TRINITY_DN14623_c8_g1_i1::g.104593::m.104593